MGGGWRTLSDGRKVFIPNAAASSQSKSRSFRIPNIKLAPNIYKTEAGFTTPNAYCPICGEKVFFYSHPNGARVFFDSLGPPWPIHPCVAVNEKSSIKAVKATSWRQAGWNPLFFDKKVDLESGTSIRVQAHNKQLTLRFEIEKSILRKYKIAAEDIEQLLMQSKQVSSSSFKVQIHNGISFFEVTASAIVQINKKDLKNIKNSFIASNRSIPFKKLKKTKAVELIKLKSSWKISLENKGQRHVVESSFESFQALGTDHSKLAFYYYKTKKNLIMLYIVNSDTYSFIKEVLPKKGVSQNVVSHLTSKNVVDGKGCRLKLRDIVIDTTISDDYWLLKGYVSERLFCGLVERNSHNKNFQTLISSKSTNISIESKHSVNKWFGTYKVYLENKLLGRIPNIPLTEPEPDESQNLVENKKKKVSENMIKKGKNPEFANKLLEAINRA
ncbi:hypothetical protein [Colwellia sp. MEBiC06753]